LRRAGLVDWRCAPGDIRGDDLPHAAEFHLTSRGRDSLTDSGGSRAHSIGLGSSPQRESA
jgi:hypothetical protein